MSAVPWTPGMVLRCSGCGRSQEPPGGWDGCDRCGAPYEPAYADGIRCPIPPGELTDLGARATPLVAWRGETQTLLKLESLNPTGSHKDRFHSVTSAIARLAGMAGVVTTSTGNHGVSCAAHAARDGLACTVLATGELPRALAVQVAGYGARVIGLAPTRRRDELRRLVAEGWMPATASDPALSGAANPYGADGYRTIADEIVATLGCTPALVALPVASGDLLVGVARGFLALAAASGSPMPVLAACQPEAAAPLAASIAVGRQVVLSQPHSIARSTSDPASGRLAVAAVRAHGVAVTVPEDEIAAATRELASGGFYVETSSALAFAGVARARRLGVVAEDATAVAVLTASGRGWSEDADGLFSPSR